MKRRSFAATILVVIAGSAIFAAGCRRANNNPNLANTNQPTRTRPFSAKEPLQYRATRVTSHPDNAPYEVGIARDGDRRRLDYTEAGKPITLLELPEGRILVDVQAGMFARLPPDGPIPSGSPTDESPLAPDVSPERLNVMIAPEAEYQRLRAETLAGRAVTVYQVRFGQTQTLIWIDDETQFPLRSETAAVVNGERQGATVMEIRGLALGPPPTGWFDIPPGLREVPIEEFRNGAK